MFVNHHSCEASFNSNLLLCGACLLLLLQVKLVGKRGVYKDTELEEEGGKIFENKDIIYNCAFSMCDMVAGINELCISSPCLSS